MTYENPAASRHVTNALIWTVGATDISGKVTRAKARLGQRGR